MSLVFCWLTDAVVISSVVPDVLSVVAVVFIFTEVENCIVVTTVRLKAAVDMSLGVEEIPDVKLSVDCKLSAVVDT